MQLKDIIPLVVSVASFVITFIVQWEKIANANWQSISKLIFGLLCFGLGIYCVSWAFNYSVYQSFAIQNPDYGLDPSNIDPLYQIMMFMLGGICFLIGKVIIDVAVDDVKK